MNEPTTLLPEPADRQSSDSLWDIEDVKAHMKASESTVRRRMAEGLPSKKIGGLLRFDPEAVRRWVAEQGDAAA